jgi:SAM-dependent methyltransferase
VVFAGWEWDETLYAGSAPFYPVGRMPYPSAVADALRAELCLDGRGRMLDVGCGPGSLTLLLAPLFESAVGIDADPDMIAQAGVQAKRAAVHNVTWYRMRAEDLPGRLGEFRVVTFAQSFHWLDRPRVARLVRSMLTCGGACVHVHASTHRGVRGEDRLPYPRPPHTGIDALVARYLGPVRRAGRGLLPAGTPDGEDEIIRSAGFRGPVRIEAGGGTVVERTADEVRAAAFSLSSAAPHLFGDRLDEFDRDLREILRAASPSGRFCERTRAVVLSVWRPRVEIREPAAACRWSAGSGDPPAPGAPRAAGTGRAPGS